MSSLCQSHAYAKINMELSEFTHAANGILAQGIAKKPVKVIEGPAVLRDGTTFEPLPVTNSSEAGRLIVVMLMKHIADMHLTLVDVISEKYGIPAAEIVESIRQHPRWEELNTQPMINLLGEHDWKECPKPASSNSSVKSGTGRGRPKMTEEQKKAAKAVRDAKKIADPPPETFTVAATSTNDIKSAESVMEVLDEAPPVVVVAKKKKKVIITNVSAEEIVFE